jgi:S-sulfosulfanyl-L-cysteine sulfohydrolase
MSKLSRREFVYMMAVLGAAPVFANSHTRMTDTTNKLEDYYKLKPFGNARFLHMTDSHAQLLPVYILGFMVILVSHLILLAKNY